ETDVEAEKISTSLIRMMLGVLTGNIDYMQPPSEMTADLRELAANPAFQRMLKYSFIGSKGTVRAKTEDFLKETAVHEVLAADLYYRLRYSWELYALRSAMIIG